MKIELQMDSNTGEAAVAYAYVVGAVFAILFITSCSKALVESNTKENIATTQARYSAGIIKDNERK